MHACSGLWELIPELSFYDEGEAPVHCLYRISVDATLAHFELNWTQQDGQSVAIAFGGKVDAVPREVESPAGAKASYTVIENNTLDSAMFVNDVQVAYARRVVSQDGSLMSVLQVNTKPDGERVRITQVYRRIEA